VNQIVSFIKTVIPFFFRRLRHITERREEVFDHALQKFLQDPETCGKADRLVLKDLIYGWGNEIWSAQGEYLAHCINHALTTEGPILECGSGLSTILLGAIAKRRAYELWALEHSPKWAERVNSHLKKYQIDAVKHCTQDLKDYGDYCWYNPPLEAMPQSFSLIICDGPPSNTKGGRYGLVPLMRDRIKSGCIILLDDAGRKREAAIVRRWEEELTATSAMHGALKQYVEMKVGLPSSQ
jgi:hypothetical protein